MCVQDDAANLADAMLRERSFGQLISAEEDRHRRCLTVDLRRKSHLEHVHRRTEVEVLQGLACVEDVPARASDADFQVRTSRRRFRHRRS